MRKLICLVVLPIVLVACERDRQVSQSEQVESPRLESTTQEAATEQAVVNEIDGALDRLNKLASISIRYDRERTLANGEIERQVFVEMLGASADQTDASITEVLEGAGFSTKKGLVDENGIRIQYRKKDVNPLNILIRSRDSGPPLKMADATSSLYIRQLVL